MNNQATSPASNQPDPEGLELARRFAELKPVDDLVAQRIKAVRQATLDVAILISMTTPKSREQSVAITKLEEACMWAVRAALADPLGKIEDELHTPGVDAQTLPARAWMQVGAREDAGGKPLGGGSPAEELPESSPGGCAEAAV